jgi:hypothetical protein
MDAGGMDARMFSLFVTRGAGFYGLLAGRWRYYSSVYDDPCNTLLWSSVIRLPCVSALYHAHRPLMGGNVSVHIAYGNRADIINLFTCQ